MAEHLTCIKITTPHSERVLSQSQQNLTVELTSPNQFITIKLKDSTIRVDGSGAVSDS